MTLQLSFLVKAIHKAAETNFLLRILENSKAKRKVDPLALDDVRFQEQADLLCLQ